ncbi:MAG: respiratory nitrate reductase subunit gamma [Syntrophorhabdaceae bacterium]|nr:respiratory nitrate reductase subunit gamma [Syntrophorhabdaceae bacterium]
MGSAVVIIFYGSILFCLVGVVVRLIKFIKMPVHLKWEFYKGSSIYEQMEWWTKEQVNLWEKVKSTILDVLLLREYYHRNRPFWSVLYLFHLGIYLLILWHVWLFIASVAVEPETASTAGLIWGHTATALAFIGGLGILIKRITDSELKLYYPPLHYIKWVVMLFTLLEAFYAVQYYFDASMPALLKYVKTQVTFGDIEHKLHPPPATAIHVLLASIWLIYLPFSHIMRLFLRYYHYLVYDDVPNVKGGPMEHKIRKLLGLSVSWSAPHIQKGKTWGEVATEIPKELSKGAAGK